ncbi:MAG: glucose-1-phosphate thymidylyltransferase [Candidatus Melainabacteria bacterium]|nr:glucose-1-phosphate thymidylyltransferase [Candidatus Melainabacteria bacterium]
MSSQALAESTALQGVKALILAGGKGTRLRPLTYAMAKQLVPVANKPILHYALDTLYEAGIRDFGIIISPETGEAIQASVAEWQPTGTHVTFIPQSQPLGLAHAVKTAHLYLQQSPFVMYLGDNLINCNLRDMIQAFLDDLHCDASILLKEVPNPSSFGVAELNEAGQVTRLVEKPKEPRSNLALVGVYLFKHSIFRAIEQIQPSWRGELEITDAIQQLIQTGQVVHSAVHEGWWLDTGKKDDMLAANQTVLSNWIRPDAVQQRGDVDNQSSLTGLVDVGEGTRIRHSQITGPVRIGKNCHLENVVIGPCTSIGDGCRIISSQLADSVILQDCTIEMFPEVIEQSLVGQSCRLVGHTPKCSAAEATGQSSAQHIRLLLADHSEILLTESP